MADKNAVFLTRHIGNTTYKVRVYLSETAEETMEDVKGKSREEAAVQWMEEHFDSLQSTCYAAGILIEKVADILQLLPHTQEAEAGKEAAQHG